MHTKKSTIIFLIVAFVLVGGITLIANSSSAPQTSAGSETTNSGGNTSGGTKSYTLAEVSKHSNSSNCWTIVRTNVYNLTDWIYSHPGGAGAILSMCGKDATVAFEAQHSGQPRPENELAGLEIGTYKQ